MDAMFLSNGGAEKAGNHTAAVQERHAEAPAVFIGRLTLHAGETKESAATLRAEETQETKRRYKMTLLLGHDIKIKHQLKVFTSISLT